MKLFKQERFERDADTANMFQLIVDFFLGELQLASIIDKEEIFHITGPTFIIVIDYIVAVIYFLFIYCFFFH